MNIISMNTALLADFQYISVYTSRKADRDRTHIQAFKLVLTNDVSPRDSQDDKIFPKHFEINLKLNMFIDNKEKRI